MSRAVSTRTPLGRLCHLYGVRLLDVAASTGIRYSKLSDVCQGTRAPTPAQRERLAQAFSVPLHTFDYPYENDYECDHT